MTHPEFVKVVTHYGLTREEYAEKVNSHPSCWDDRFYPICNNGGFHEKQRAIKQK